MRKRIQAVIIVVLLTANMLASCANKQDPTSTTEPEKKEIDYENDISILNGASNTKVDGPDSALYAIEELSEQLGIHNVSKELTFSKEDQVFENNYYTFEQKYEGIPVYGRKEVVVADSEGTVLTVAGNYVNLSKLETSPRINEEEAYDAVFEYYGENADIYCNGLVIYSLHDIKPQLSWNLTVKTEQFDEECIVSAINGEILYTNSLLSYNEGKGVGEDIDNNTENFNVVFEDGHYAMKDNERNIFMYDAGNSDLQYEFVLLDSNGNIYKIKTNNRIVDEKGKTVDIRDNGKIYDEKGNYLGEDYKWAIEASTSSIFTKLKPLVNDKNTWDNKKAVTIYSRLEKIYDMWLSEFQCSGYDNKNGTVHAVCNDNYRGDTNAYSDSRQSGGLLLLSFGANNSLAMDTIGHEYMHGIIRDCCNIDTKGEPGAINEGLADVFGEIAEDWLKNNKLDGDCDWIHTGIRSAISPNQSPKNKKYPDTYKGNYWENTDNSSLLSKVFGDDGGAHTNCTVIFHIAYLMSTGINGDARFKPLSNYQIAKLFYSTLKFLPADCSFSELRSFTETIAEIMHEQGELTEKQRNCVSYAFFEAKIPKTAVPVGKNLHLKIIPGSGDERGYIDYTLYVTDSENNKLIFNGSDIQRKGVVFPHYGEYELQIVDNKYKDKAISTKVKVYEKGGKEEITLYTTFGSETNNDTWKVIIDNKTDESYKQVIEKLEKEYGPLEINICKTEKSEVGDDYRKEADGLCYLELIDFNNDGVKELLAVAKHMSDEDYTVYVYTIENNSVKELFTSKSVLNNFDDNYRDLYIKTNDDHESFIDGGFSYDGFEYYKIYGMKGNTFGLISASCIIDTYNRVGYDSRKYYYIFDYPPEEFDSIELLKEPGISKEEYETRIDEWICNYQYEYKIITLMYGLTESDVQSGYQWEDYKKELEKAINKTKEEVGIIQNSSSSVSVNNDSWKQSYIDYIETDPDIGFNPEWCTCGLIYLDSDDIPELIIEYSNEADGTGIVSLKNESIVSHRFSRTGGIGYTEREGLVHNNIGVMGSYVDEFVFLDDDGFHDYGHGYRYGESQDFTNFTHFVWNDEEVSEEEFMANIDKYNNKQLKNWNTYSEDYRDNNYSPDEMREYLMKN